MITGIQPFNILISQTEKMMGWVKALIRGWALVKKISTAVYFIIPLILNKSVSSATGIFSDDNLVRSNYGFSGNSRTCFIHALGVGDC